MYSSKFIIQSGNFEAVEVECINEPYLTEFCELTTSNKTHKIQR